MAGVCVCVCLGDILEAAYRDGMRPGDLAVNLSINEEVNVRYYTHHEYHDSLLFV